MNETYGDEMILANLIASRKQKWPERDVLTFVSVEPDGAFSTETRTYTELWENGQRIAAGLVAEQMRSGDAFAVITQNHPEFVDVMVGSSIVGTVFVPIDPRTKGKKLAFMLEHAECRGAVVGDYAASQLLEILAQCPSLEWLWILGAPPASIPAAIRSRALDEVLATPSEDMAIQVTDPETPMQMLYTSGTTGDPKAILSPYSRFGMIASLGEALGLVPGDRPYTGLSLTHANAQLITLGIVLSMGLRGVFSRKFYQVATVGYHSRIRLYGIQLTRRHDDRDLQRARKRQ